MTDENVYIFCPEQPELRVRLRRKQPVVFNNGRLDAQAARLTADEIAYFENIARQALEAGGDPKFIVWRGDLRDPRLRSLLETRVATTVINSATAVVGPQVMHTVALRLSAMLAQTGQISGADLSSETRSLMLSHLSQRPSSGLGDPNARAQAEARSRIEAEAAREQAQKLAEEQRMINEAAAQAMAAGQMDPGQHPDADVPPPSPETTESSLEPVTEAGAPAGEDEPEGGPARSSLEGFPPDVSTGAPRAPQFG